MSAATRAVLVIGAQGVLGSLVAEAFDAAGWRAVRAGRRPDARADVRPVDLDRPGTIVAALADVDAVVSTVPDAALAAERAVLREGGLLVNAAAAPASACRELRASLAQPRGTVLLNGGVAPGVTNLVAADLLRAHPEADEVELALTITASGTSGRAGGEFIHEHLSAQARHRTSVLPLPPPYGARRCIEFAEDARGWLGDVTGERAVHSYMCFRERPLGAVISALNRAGLMSRLPRAPFVAGRSRAPASGSAEPIAEWVAVARAGERLAARTIECAGDYASTAAAAVIFVEALLERSETLAPGCFVPDELLALDDVAAPLTEAGIRIVER